MHKILIIEDDLVVSNIYRNKLSVEGFTVDVVHTGEEALFHIAKNTPDLIILDLGLPTMNGLDVLKQIRANATMQKTPIIVFSNTYLTKLIQDAWKAGATKCLSKTNCSPKEVLESVRGSLGFKVEGAPKGATVFTPRAKIAQDTKESDEQTAFRTDFSSIFPTTITALRTSIKELSKATTDSDRAKHATDLFGTAHKLTSHASVTGFNLVVQLSEALEALTTELHQKPETINTSTIRTLASAIDLLPALQEYSSRFDAEISSSSSILVVDDEPIARRAVNSALERAKLKSVDVDDANVALKLLSENSYDLVFLDVDMPNINGHELCSKLRAMPRHKTTPVVFVTSNTDLKNRASSMISGGNDFIGKPFHFLELAVKSLVYVLRAKIQPQKVA